MRWKRPRFTIGALMIVIGVVAVVLAVVLTLPVSRLFPTRGLLLVGPALLLLVHRVILLGLVRREERMRKGEGESEWPRRW